MGAEKQMRNVCRVQSDLVAWQTLDPPLHTPCKETLGFYCGADFLDQLI